MHLMLRSLNPSINAFFNFKLESGATMINKFGSNVKILPFKLISYEDSVHCFNNMNTIHILYKTTTCCM